MKLLVLGATGGTGLEIVKLAVERGHSVTGYVRSPVKLGPFRDRIVVRQGDLLNISGLEQVARGHDAVLSAFGPRLPLSDGDATLLRRFGTALVSGMRNAGVRRVVVESVALLFKNSIVPPAYLLGRLFFPTKVADAAEMERVFEESDLDWTLVRPPELTNTARTGNYRLRDGHLPRFGFRISRADVADFMIKAVEKQLSIRRIVGISS